MNEYVNGKIRKWNKQKNEGNERMNKIMKEMNEGNERINKWTN